MKKLILMLLLAIILIAVLVLVVILSGLEARAAVLGMVVK